MITFPSFLLPLALGLFGVAMSDEDEFEWGDPDEDYESPFADDADDPFELDDVPDEDAENPFASESKDEADADDDADDRPSSLAQSEEATSVKETDASEESESPDRDERGEPDESDTLWEDQEESKGSEELEEPEGIEQEDDEFDELGVPSGGEEESVEEADVDGEGDVFEEEIVIEEEGSLATVAEARSLCDDAMRALHEGDADRAFDRLGTHWAFSPDEMTELQAEVGRTRAIVADRYGDALDYRLVRKDTVDDVLARFVYLERFERHGLRWRFTFYEGGNEWTLNDVYFDDEIEALFDGG